MAPLNSLLVLISFAICVYSQCSTDFDWPSLTPSPNLNWTSCYGGPYECTRLKVPLNYSDVDGPDATIAVIRIPSAYSPNSTEYRGPILLNPGGPGGSGVDLVLGGLDGWLPRLSDAYDIVSFDPRGVSRSTPEVQRFPTPLASALFGETSYAFLSNFLPPLSIPGNIGLTLAKGEVTNAVYAGHASSYLPFINTPNTATDMLRIVQAHGLEKLTYYGVSYGTVLGSTFATMYPDKVERMILDGVFDVDAYYAGELSFEVTDTDKALDFFFKTCFEAGPTGCAFYDSSQAKISANFDALLARLRVQPLPVFVDEATYGILDYGSVLSLVRSMLYAPFQQFPVLAEALAQAQQGNGTILFAHGGAPPTFTCDCVNSVNSAVNGVDALVTIGCNDAVYPDRTFEDWEAYYDSAAKVSRFAEVLVGLAMRCSGWPVPNDKKITPKHIGGNTSVPILFIGNTIDPITALSGAVAMSRRFPGSAVLTQDSAGHSSFAGVSNCTTDAVVRYLANATLPEPGTVCEVEGSIFAENDGL